MLLLAFVVQISFAQQKIVTGTVTGEDGIPLPGVNIIIKGTSTGVQSDFDGNYSIEASFEDILVFSFIGLETAEYPVGLTKRVDVTLKAGSAQLDQVVITALGIKREKKSLGYATQEIGGAQVSDVPTTNFMNSLSGKVAGLNIKSSGTMGGSSNVVIRGSASLTGNNQALFIVDGTPISNDNTNTADQKSGRGGYDYGNAAADINPNNIASINVLKGAAATTLYGSRASNGVIIITTKRGSKGKGIGVSLSSSLMISNADILYNGNMANWDKFANSLQLRLGMRLSDINPILSKSTAEAAIAAGVFESNADNAQLVYQSNPPRTNPLWVDLVQSGRADYLPAATIVDIMNDLEDPRRATYFFNETVDDYIGGVYRGTNNYGLYSHVGEVFLDPTLPGILLDYVEVEFNLTKAADLGYTGAGVTSAHYNAAITASIEYWGGTQADATAYLAQPAVAYDGSNNQFATQFWLAMYNNPFEGWSVWRKL